MVADLNLLGSVGDLYCFSNTFSMLLYVAPICCPLVEIVILWIYYIASLLASASFGTFVTSLFNFLNYFVWLRITDEGSVPEMRI